MDRKVIVITAACISLATPATGICVSPPSEVTRLEQGNTHDCTNIAKRFTGMVSEQLGINENEIAANASFDGDLGADSLDRVELLMGAEEEFGIVITDEEAVNITTINSAIDLIEKKCMEK
jgi:acyl carrier protein